MPAGQIEGLREKRAALPPCSLRRLLFRWRNELPFLETLKRPAYFIN